MRATLAPIAIAALLTSVSAQASVLYSQAWAGGSTSYASQTDTNSGGFGNFATVYDSFTLGSSAKITSVDFVGNYFNPTSPGTITGFTIGLYSNSGGAPGALLQSASVAGNGNEASLGSVDGFPMASYSVATNFIVSAGQTYWLAVVPDLGFPPQWGWAQGFGGDGSAVQDFLGDRAFVSGDVAFTLNGGAVPEPGSWALMILGFGTMGTALRRRRALAAA